MELLGDDVLENSDDTLIGCWTTDDEDLAQNHTYFLIDDAGSRFVVKGTCIYTSSNASLNFEEKQEYNVTVRSTDDGVPPLSLVKTFLITVLDVNEPPSVISVSSLKVRRRIC